MSNRSVTILPEQATEIRVQMRPVRGCPACWETHCADPAQCLYWLTSRPWGPCDNCDGTGWGNESTMGAFCDGCCGSGLIEYAQGSLLSGISRELTDRLTAHVDHLRVRVA
ncbi:hypothetical protein ACFY1A_35210 [Streptomyces sp. NPDC001520]|uniref:hypothetical protein n=1 Tax=Streptomyces sp. NPDC001520 TaxID=3364581 RepID=UPI00368D0D5D